MREVMVEKEVLEALSLVNSGQDFLMKGGAGSGKTHSMLDFLEKVYETEPRISVACITFTNVAVTEIRSRFPATELQVSTIHDFVWNLVSQFQKDIRLALSHLVNSREIPSSWSTPIAPGYWDAPIRYKEWLNLELGEVSHNEVLKIAKYLFGEYPKLARILADRYDLILIDEYQDTPTEMLRILLEELPAPEVRSMRIGFFGDSQQSIHEERKGDEIIDGALSGGRLTEILKAKNRRNPAAVIRLINNLRADNLQQVQADDPAAPNFEKEGSAKFIYTVQNQLTGEEIRELSFCRSWNFTSEKTKLLFLSKAMIAQEMRFPRLMDIYTKDRVVQYAKKIKDSLGKQGLSVPTDMNFGQALARYADSISPTPVQQRAFNAEPDLLDSASGYLFQDIANTSMNSDRLIGTKKVSEFDDRDRGEKRDDLVNHLILIQELRWLYRQGKFSQVIRKLDRPMQTIMERERVASDLETLCEMDNRPISEVIAFADGTGLVKQKDAIRQYIERQPYRYARVTTVSFNEVASLYDYVEDHSPYSTQHGVKGSEWENVFISLDNGGWNNFNFEKFMANPTSSDTVESRSRMMLYVTCSRAKENLLVYAHQPSEKTLNQVRQWFGVEQVVGLDS